MKRTVRAGAALTTALFALVFLGAEKGKPAAKPKGEPIRAKVGVIAIVTGQGAGYGEEALGFWWTCSGERSRPPLRGAESASAVDVMIPVYDEPVNVVEPTVAAAVAMTGARHTVHLLDDGDNPAMERIAARHGARYITRAEHSGAKAGNLNHALALTGAPYVL